MEFKDLRENMQFVTKDGTCVEYAGQAKDTEDRDVAMFEVFETGHIIFAPIDTIDSLMTEQEFVRVGSLEWKKRQVALKKFQANPETTHKNYLGMYAEMGSMSEDEIKTEYKKISSR